MAEIVVEKVLESCKKNLERGRAIATGIGIFAFIDKDGSFLLRRRQEKGSLYDKDLSGKWELPGGGAELVDFSAEYDSAPINCLIREVREECGLILKVPLLNDALYPAWLAKDGIIDLAFVVIIPFSSLEETPEFTEKISGPNPELVFVRMAKEGQNIWHDFADKIVSKRMYYLIEQGLPYSICSAADQVR